VCVLTRVTGACRARNVGFGRATLGAGGGRAAVCGDAASGLKGTLEVGTVMGGTVSWGGGWGFVTARAGVEPRDDQEDIMARRGHEYGKETRE
jgi:hypothetical protein